MSILVCYQCHLAIPLVCGPIGQNYMELRDIFGANSAFFLDRGERQNLLFYLFRRTILLRRGKIFRNIPWILDIQLGFTPYSLFINIFSTVRGCLHIGCSSRSNQYFCKPDKIFGEEASGNKNLSFLVFLSTSSSHLKVWKLFFPLSLEKRKSYTLKEKKVNIAPSMYLVNTFSRWWCFWNPRKSWGEHFLYCC